MLVVLIEIRERERERETFRDSRLVLPIGAGGDDDQNEDGDKGGRLWWVVQEEDRPFEPFDTHPPSSIPNPSIPTLPLRYATPPSLTTLLFDLTEAITDQASFHPTIESRLSLRRSSLSPDSLLAAQSRRTLFCRRSVFSRLYLSDQPSSVSDPTQRLQPTARQIGFEDGSECPQICKLAYEYLKKSKECESTIYEYFADEPNVDELYVKLVEEFDRCILAYIAFHWSQASLMISQDENVASDDAEDDGDANGSRQDRKGDEVEEEDEGRHAKMLQEITGLPAEAFEGRFLADCRDVCSGGVVTH
ncbi:hypothetical protein TEA_016837 [Camellia sinensis var. sinensis]|uniref:Uncharacterized protein n=1 Tax=Camellia sinensis var. sinensis TaxID=542762 RepID=A0A4S4D2E4_CAMSN|nr:hypothetical protein TEA_016837 [Camellia sinensis var. sinensis]